MDWRDGDDADDGFTPRQEWLVRRVSFVAGALSTLGSALIAVLFCWRGRKARRRRKLFPVRIIFYMSLYDLLNSLFTVAGAAAAVTGFNWAQTGWCDAQGVVVQYAYTCSNLWTAALAVVVRRQLVDSAATVERPALHVAINGIAALSAAVPLLGAWEGVAPESLADFAQYGPAGPWCWIGERHGLARQLLFYVPLYLMELLVCGSYAVIVRSILRGVRELKELEVMRASEIESRRELARSFVWYPIAFFLMWLPAIINRLHSLVFRRVHFTLTLAQATLTPAQGAVNCVIYVLTSNWGRHRVFAAVVHSRDRISLFVASAREGAVSASRGLRAGSTRSFRASRDTTSRDGGGPSDDEPPSPSSPHFLTPHSLPASRLWPSFASSRGTRA